MYKRQDHTNVIDKQCMVLGATDETSAAAIGATFDVSDNLFLGFVSGAGALSFDNVVGVPGKSFIRRNIFHTNKGPATAFGLGGRGTIIESNLVNGLGDAKTVGTAIAVTGAVVRNNTVLNYYRGLSVGAGSAYNNLLKNIGDFDWIADVPANIYSNLSFNVGRRAPLGQGAGNLTMDPLIDAYGRPLIGSPVIGAGHTLAKYTRDIEGRQRRRAPSIGAYDVAAMCRKTMGDPSL